MTVRERLIKKRTALKLSHDQVASLAGVSRTYYTNIECGRRTPSMPVAKRIADVLKCKVDDLFFDSDVEKRNNKKNNSA